MDSTESPPELLLRRFLLFAVAGRLCACDLESVREIVPERQATRLPGAPEWVRGLVNLRGTIITVIDLAVRLGTARAPGAAGSIVVVEAAGRTFGLLAATVRGVHAVDESALEEVDARRAAGGIVCGLAHVPEAGAETALVVDIPECARQALAA